MPRLIRHSGPSFRHWPRPRSAWTFSACKASRRGISLSPQEIWTAIEKDPRFQDWQEGRISPRDLALASCERLGGSLSFEQFTRSLETAHSILSHSRQFPVRISPQKFRHRASYPTPIRFTSPILGSDLTILFRFYPKIDSQPLCVVGASKPSPLFFATP